MPWGRRHPPHPPCVAQCALGLQASVDASRYTIVISSCAAFSLLSAPPAGGYAPLVFSIVARFCMAVFCGNAAACRLACDALAIGSEKDAKLAQNLGQLQRFIAVLPQECMANLHLLGQPNTFLTG